MAYVDWMIKGPELATCNCDWGCPCQFNALPTRGDCRAVLALRVDEGHFGDVRLEGIKAAAVLAWPRAIHEGHGQALAIIDEQASQEQREALLKILSGQETEPFATIFILSPPWSKPFTSQCSNRLSSSLTRTSARDASPFQDLLTLAQSQYEIRSRAKSIAPRSYFRTDLSIRKLNMRAVPPKRQA